MKILIIGASGFIGSFIVEEALRRGYETWAGIRKTSSRQYLSDERIKFLELQFDNEDRLTEQLMPHQFDYIVDAAGATKCKRSSDFFAVNTEGTKRIVNAVLRSGMNVKKFVYLSSLSVFGAPREKEPHEDIEETDPMMPNTFYGKSKLEAERFLSTVKDKLNYVILRPTGVYGPREKDYYLMVKSIKQHVDFAVGFSKQEITFVYVTDVVDAVFLTFDKQESGNCYFLTDGEVYESNTFSNYIRKELNNPLCFRIVAPIWLTKAICTLGDMWGRISGQVTALNNDKFHILSQRNWRCDISKTVNELGYIPKVKLEDGVRKTVEWYKQSGWI
jgi:dihydroflavonol-4-reductase